MQQDPPARTMVLLFSAETQHLVALSMVRVNFTKIIAPWTERFQSMFHNITPNKLCTTEIMFSEIINRAYYWLSFIFIAKKIKEDKSIKLGRMKHHISTLHSQYAQ